ncbi:hypothetical protein HYFRA_00004570 [Hymenoscyphus fraxineus]|uniref:Uncharacterized protein n=1 Tax=Hymenoscyphus fraxineus TaxID=746836 RepID=A0A9N9PIM9_9HELO|nr:hypothetical protein HYFRA_00004570 [Hymenoscyphus fraxineus]
MHLRFDNDDNPISYESYTQCEPLAVASDHEGKPTSTLTEESFTFDGGDIEILVRGTNDQVLHGRVCSQVMVMQSPIQLLLGYPPFAQLPSDSSTAELGIGQSSGSLKSRFFDQLTRPVEQLDFTTDDPEALHILLSIAHLRVKEVPRTYLPYQKILDLALLCDQYDNAALLSAHLPQWLPREARQWRKTGQVGWIWIAFAFGKHSMFQHLAAHLVQQVSETKENLCIPCSDGRLRYLLPEELPPGVMENTKRLRSQTINILISLIASWMEPLASIHTTRCLRDDKDCDLLFHFKFVRGLCRLGMWPLNPSRPITESLKCLVDKLLRLVSTDLKIDKKWNQHQHAECRDLQRFEKDIKGVMALIPRHAIRDCQKVSMDRTRSKIMRD